MELILAALLVLKAFSFALAEDWQSGWGALSFLFLPPFTPHTLPHIAELKIQVEALGSPGF